MANFAIVARKAGSDMEVTMMCRSVTNAILGNSKILPGRLRALIAYQARPRELLPHCRHRETVNSTYW